MTLHPTSLPLSPPAPRDDGWYQRSLERVDKLMNKVAPGTPEETEYLRLLDELEEYENLHFPI